MRGEWIEITGLSATGWLPRWSLPMRGEWIEILAEVLGADDPSVSPHAGRVD